MSELRAALFAATLCVVPDPPAIPDGAKARDGEMVRARADVAAFVAASEVYLNCLGEQIDSAEPNAPVAALEARHDRAIAHMNYVAAEFNAQLEIWKAR